jgi:hypothetical protein
VNVPLGVRLERIGHRGVGRDSNRKETASCSARLVDRDVILLFPRIVFRALQSEDAAYRAA